MLFERLAPAVEKRIGHLFEPRRPLGRTSEVRFDADGLHLVTANRPEAVKARVAEAAPRASQLAKYPGAYSSDEVGATCDISAGGGKLPMTTRHGGQDRVSTKSKLAGEMLVLGEVIVKARERAGLKQSDVAARLGLPPSHLSKVENGTRRLDVIELIHIAEAIHTDPADILRELTKRLGR